MSGFHIFLHIIVLLAALLLMFSHTIVNADEKQWETAYSKRSDKDLSYQEYRRVVLRASAQMIALSSIVIVFSVILSIFTADL